MPGKWSAADFRYQAEHMVTSKLNNAGHNSIATQVLLLPSQWDGSDRLLDQIRHLLGALPPRPDYYPGANQRLADILRAHPDAESYAGRGRGCGLLVPDLTGDQDLLLRQEAFASALGVVRLPGADARSFLTAAVDFSNDRLPGTLGATMIVDPALGHGCCSWDAGNPLASQIAGFARARGLSGARPLRLARGRSG